MARDGWTTVTPQSVCGICKHGSWCRVGERMIHCQRVESDKPAKGGGWYHPLGTNLPPPPPRRPKPPRLSDAQLDEKWRKVLGCCRPAPANLDALATAMGVARWTLDALRIQWDGCQYLIPSRSPSGLITGIDTRWVNGRKMVLPGSRRGLIYASDWQDYPGPVIVCEGASDVLAALTMHLCVIGRPSNIGGVEQLARMLRHVQRPVIVMAERDRKRHEDLAPVVQAQHDPNCGGCLRCWPGFRGALITADALHARLGRPVNWAFTPSEKDTRSWLLARKIDVANPDACARLGVELRMMLRPGKKIAL